MAFRDENEALRAKVRALEEQVERLEGELADEQLQPESDAFFSSLEREAVVDDAPTDVAGLIQARDRARSDVEARAEGKRAKRAARFDAREPRVTVSREAGRTRVVIAPEVLADRFTSQSALVSAFLFLNPGVGVMIMVAGWLSSPELESPWAWLLAGVSWAGVLALGNLAYAYTRQRRITIELTEDGHCAVFVGAAMKPLLFGRTAEMKIRPDEPDRSCLGGLFLSDGDASLSVKGLTARDLEVLRGIDPLRRS